MCRGEKKKTSPGDLVVSIQVEGTEQETEKPAAGHVHSENSCSGESSRPRQPEADGAAERAQTRDIYWVSVEGVTTNHVHQSCQLKLSSPSNNPIIVHTCMFIPFFQNLFAVEVIFLWVIHKTVIRIQYPACSQVTQFMISYIKFISICVQFGSSWVHPGQVLDSYNFYYSIQSQGGKRHFLSKRISLLATAIPARLLNLITFS